YIVMEYLEGGNLRQKMAARPMDPREAAGLVLRLAEAVGAMHAAGLVHRDLKPENVLLAADGSPRVADFGLARPLDDEVRPGLTTAGQLVGTPRYMAPEQAAGHDLRGGPGVDVYSLGAILYELLTGRPPFQGATVAETFALVLSQDPKPPRRIAPGVPADLETVCLRCLRKEPARRYTAAALAEDLRRFLDGRPILARPPRLAELLWKACRRRPLVASLSGALGLTLLVLGVVGPLAASRQARLAAESREQYELAQRAIRDVVATLDTELVHRDDIPTIRSAVLTRVVGFQKRLVELRPGSVQARSALAFASFRAAKSLMDQERWREALALLGEALPLEREAAGASPSGRTGLARNRTAAAQALAGLGRNGEAAAALREAEAAFDATEAAGQVDAEAAGVGVEALVELAHLDVEAGRSGPARARLDRAARLFEAHFRRKSPEPSPFRLVARIESARADLAAREGRRDEAVRAAREAVDMTDVVFASLPHNADVRCDVALSFVQLAGHLAPDDPAAAETLYREAMFNMSSLMDVNPSLAKASRLHQRALLALETLLRSQGRAEDADALRRQSQQERMRRVGQRTRYPLPREVGRAKPAAGPVPPGGPETRAVPGAKGR
ncbi:MAG: serine/threonine-protein kinase, partial [Isosphaeraceae bacterium]